MQFVVSTMRNDTIVDSCLITFQVFTILKRACLFACNQLSVKYPAILAWKCQQVSIGYNIRFDKVFRSLTFYDGSYLLLFIGSVIYANLLICLLLT